jgi:ABC-type uncharacterized transport system substrate-binding protein
MTRTGGSHGKPHRTTEIRSCARGAAAWPLAARAQQTAVPVIGFLEIRSPEMITERLRAFRQGLKETGYVEGENIAIDYRWAEQMGRLPDLAAQLVRRQVAVIVTAGGFATARAAKDATTTIPIVFGVSDDPVKHGLVASLARPGGNLTGVNLLSTELTAKRLDLLREMLPRASRIAVLVNPANTVNTQTTLREVEAAARAMGLQIQSFNASTSPEIDAAFAAFGRERPDAVFVGQDAFYNGRRLQLANWASRHALPMTSGSRDICEVGGLMSYGVNIVDTYRQEGVYTGRILKGAKPADLPVEQSAKFELVINAQTARMLGLEIPPTLLARADEVIE